MRSTRAASTLASAAGEQHVARSFNRDATLAIAQSTPYAVIDWRSFSIGAGRTVSFDNPGGGTLNRVTGPSISKIDSSPASGACTSSTRRPS
jgi:large exoprotein involved in heme utilization and adhesion